MEKITKPKDNPQPTFKELQKIIYSIRKEKDDWQECEEDDNRNNDFTTLNLLSHD